MERLHPSTLSKLPGDIASPAYDREALRAGIVHLGIGAFARAHPAVATEAALHSGGELRWGIVGVSLQRLTHVTRSNRRPVSTPWRCATRPAAWRCPSNCA